ncbi:Exopolysaccharide biosynthesis transcriptional activator EpsA [Streptococcus infantarius subsp. infantarius]|jgi:glycosyltransferase involved in cell wall biosynthesis|nr:Exopolysaccharide biosynthesis transcriptional activator EpsA [Streptococcus infantarius subsp. infantarius]
MKPLLSVIVPVYNVEKYLKRCLESILVQSWNDYEIILVDDGSTDSSAQICDLYAEKYEMIRVIHKENKGLSDTRNRGIEKASGEYVYFPDSDDWLEPNTFSELSDVIEELTYDIISFNREFVTSEEDKLISAKSRIQKLSGKQALLEMLNQGDVTGFANDKIYRKKLFLDNDIEFPVGKYYEDLGTNYKLFLKATKVYVTNQKYYHYLITNPDSITQSWNEQKLQDMFGFYREIYYSPLVREKFEELEIEILQAYYINGLIHILSSLYKSNISAQYSDIEKDIKQEIVKNSLGVTKLLNQPNKIKYLLYKLGLLKILFETQSKLLRYR